MSENAKLNAADFRLLEDVINDQKKRLKEVSFDGQQSMGIIEREQKIEELYAVQLKLRAISKE